MRTLLFTGYDDAMKPLGLLTVPRMAQYAGMHGFDFTCYRRPLLDVPNGIYWTGVRGALLALEAGYERVIYLDADQMVTNFEKLPLAFAPGFYASLDWGHDAAGTSKFSACGFTAHQDCCPFFREVLFLEKDYRDNPFPEQLPMQVVAERLSLPTVLQSRRVFNSVPDEVCSGKVPDPWQPGDWCAHLTMLPIDARVNLFHEIASRL